MSTPHPHSVADLVLAPILIGVERNLAGLRDCDDLEYALALALNDDDSWYTSPAERARRVQSIATRGVDLHSWKVSVTQDLQGLAIEHGHYAVTVMLGKRLAGYVQYGWAQPDATAGTTATAERTP